MIPGDQLTIIKLGLQREELWRYPATVINVFPNGILIEAFFNRSNDLPFHGVTFHPGDRFLEMYYTDRRYNIFEVYDRETLDLKCWYCNASRPAEIEPQILYYVDLALDLLVFPDGKQLLLDEVEFSLLEIPEQERKNTLQAILSLQDRFRWDGNILLSDGRI
jgi:hypothetical protein